MPSTLSPAAVRSLKAASAASNGHLPDRISRKVLKEVLTGKYAYRLDRDRYRLSVEDALASTDGPVVITLEGRRAVLSPAQTNALALHVASDGRMAPNVTWQTAKSLTVLGLVEYRDAAGVPKPTDGDTGVSGAVHYPFRTGLGQQIAELPAQPGS